MNGAVVLVVEDEVEIREFVARALRLAGAIVTTASTGEEALAAARDAAPFDLIVLDLSLPDISGWDTLDGVRPLYPSQQGCPVVIFSASSDDAGRSRAADLGVGFISKPVGATEFVERLRRFVRRPP